MKITRRLAIGSGVIVVGATTAAVAVTSQSTAEPSSIKESYRVVRHGDRADLNVRWTGPLSTGCEWQVLVPRRTGGTGTPTTAPCSWWRQR
jgi:hypothetical protein